MIYLYDSQDMAKYKIYVVFHKMLYKECYSDIPEDILRDKLAFYAVNSQIEKEYDPWFEQSVLREYALPVYIPFMQEKRFCETSAYLHMLLNKETLVEPYDFIGCFHYDMIFNKKALIYIDYILDTLPDPNNTVFYINKVPATRQFGSSYKTNGVEECLVHAGWRKVLELYNTYFKKSHVYEFIAFDDIILNHTFLLHKELFKQIAPFFIDALPLIFDLLKHNIRHMPYVLETLWGMILMLKKRETGARWVLLDIIHDEGLKEKGFLETRNTYS